MLRDHCNSEELEAHRVLDQAKAGLPVPQSTIAWALFTLGDGVGFINLTGEQNVNT